MLSVVPFGYQMIPNKQKYMLKIIFGKKERGLKIVGLTPDGKKVRRPISRVLDGDVDKRWEEFKKDLQKYLME